MSIRAEIGRIMSFYKVPLKQTKPVSVANAGKTRTKKDEPRKRGRGTAKDAVICAIARSGKVVAELVSDIASETIVNFIRKFVNTEDSELYTDQFKGYTNTGKEMKHETVNRSKEWEDDGIHTNTIKGFWFLTESVE